MFPTVRVTEAEPLQRGLAYGQLARERVRRSVEVYRWRLPYYSGLAWDKILELAAVYDAPIRESFPDYLAELHAIAAGAGVSFAEVLAINTRTEVINAALA